jgi:arylsulfatase
MPARPHILLITTDQQRFDALGLHGNPHLETPNLDALAAKGVDFARCYSTCPVCIPARRSLLSGQHPTTHGLRHYQDGLEWNPPFTLPGLLSDAGYQTQLVGKLHMHPAGKRYGFDNILLSETSNSRPTSPEQRRNDYVRWLRQHGIDDHPHFHGISGNGRLVTPWPLEDRFHHNNWLAAEASRFLCDDRDPSAPFFLHLSFFHPHPPFVPTRDYLNRYERKDLPGPVLGDWAPQGEPRPGTPPDSALGPFDPEIMRRAQAGYYALINHIDDCVAHVLERWFEYGNPRAKEPLYVLFSTDHGEMLGDHHLFRKSLGYEASAHIPFFVSAFNTQALKAGRSESLCSWEDILPTVAELAGVPLPGPVDGRSLVPQLRGEVGEEPGHILGMCHGHFSNYYLVCGRHKYIWFPDTHEEQAFDLATDPSECHDLSADAVLLAPLRELMDKEIKRVGGVEYKIEQLTPCKNQTPRVFAR